MLCPSDAFPMQTADVLYFSGGRGGTVAGAAGPACPGESRCGSVGQTMIIRLLEPTN